MSVMFVDIRPGALRSPESTEVHGLGESFGEKNKILNEKLILPVLNTLNTFKYF